MRDVERSSLKGWKCDCCHVLAHSTKTWKRDKNAKLKERETLHQTIALVLSNPEDGVFKSDSSTNAMNRLIKTNDRFFNIKGLSLKRSCIELRRYKSMVVPKYRMKAHSFLREVNSIIESNPRWEEQIEIDMLKHSMTKAVHSKKGGKSSQLSTKNRMLWVDMYQKSPCTTRMLAANINGPCERSLRRGAAKLDKANHSVSGKSIIEMTNEEAKENMCEFVKELYRSSKKMKSHHVRVPYSIDATAVASGLFIHSPSNKLVR